MSGKVQYTLYHPKWYRRHVSVWWWLENRSYTTFVLRELTSVSVAFFAFLSLWYLRALAQGSESYARFLQWLRTPLFLTLDSVAFLFILLHAVTWFNLAPKAVALRLQGKRVPDGIIAGLNYLAWLMLSVGVTWILLRG